jgi:hypothetical protein
MDSLPPLSDRPPLISPKIAPAHSLIEKETRLRGALAGPDRPQDLGGCRMKAPDELFGFYRMAPRRKERRASSSYGIR